MNYLGIKWAKDLQNLYVQNIVQNKSTKYC